jgi:glycerol-3-phosphate acyltransferase PlsY
MIPVVLALGICFLLGYLIGSVNFAVIIARSQGIDILQEGSKNPGATNVKRVMGKTAGNLVFGFDAVKGAAGTFLPFFILWIVDVSFVDPKLTFESAIQNPVTFYQLVFGFAGTIIGHCFSIFLKFKGGKGVASTIGGLLVIMPYPIIIGAVIWVITFQYTRYVSVASMALGLSLPISCALLKVFYPSLGYTFGIIGFAAIIALFNIWTHRANISRLRDGTENRFGDKSK